MVNGSVTYKCVGVSEGKWNGKYREKKRYKALPVKRRVFILKMSTKHINSARVWKSERWFKSKNLYKI